MSPDRRSRMAQRQHGFAVVAAIVIIVILAGLAAYILSISAAQQLGVALDLQGGRALQAARSGMDWGISRVVNAPTAFGGGACKPGAPPPPSPTVNLSTGPGGDFAAYNGFTVTVKCSATAFTDGVDSISYSLVATACNQPSAGGSCPNPAPTGEDYIERQLTTQVVCNATGIC